MSTELPTWKFWSEAHPSIPLPPKYYFPQAFNYFDAERNSFYILEHSEGDYIQCGGSKKSCVVEIRRYLPDGTYIHSVVGHAGGSKGPAQIQMSDGVVNVLENEVLIHWEAIELFKAFFAGEAIPERFVLRTVDQ